MVRVIAKGRTTATQVPFMVEGDEPIVYVNLANQLDSDETIAEVPTITEEGSSDLTFADTALTTEESTFDGVTAAAGQAVKFKITGMLDGTDYRVKLRFVTSTGEVMNRFVEFKVNDDA